MADPTIDAALRRVTSGLAGGEDRPAQQRMVEAVADGVTGRRHLIVQAGTGTGKSMGYLVPVLTLGARVVVATATKALQDQLATRDLPLLVDRLGAPFTYAVLKGRSNYLCRQRADEIGGTGEDQLTLDGEPDGGPGAGPLGREIGRLLAWAETAETGDRAELAWEPTTAAWSQVSVGPRDCPG
ncbi:MAG: DEAD/DEAH box helicase, partial [Acidimicrobiales bacterium]